MLHSLEAIADRLGTHTPAQVRAPAFHVITRLQEVDPSVQITACAVALCAMCEAMGLRMRDVINVAENTLRDCEGPFTEHVQAIRDYAKGELLRRDY